MTTKNDFDYFKLVVVGGTKDGTYTGAKAGVLFVVNKLPIVVESPTVKLGGKRTRGTFTGKAPDGNAVSGSFTC